ncbi:MAG: ATP-binding protein [Candidatus Omnitrophica bacterium]|nr:ATP-binding protein [Candidatus Omnitrophota bacterium]
MAIKIDLRIKSKIENIYPAEREILNQASELGYDGDACFCLRLAMDEALVNAIIHGNRNDQQKNVRVIALCDDEKIAITVQDEGDGFDQALLVDPTKEPFLYKTSGRGVYLIQQFTHEIHFNDSGNSITFVVNKSHPPAVLQSR